MTALMERVAQAHLDLLGTDRPLPRECPPRPRRRYVEQPERQSLREFTETGFWHCGRCLRNWNNPDLSWDDNAGQHRCPSCHSMWTKYHPPL